MNRRHILIFILAAVLIVPALAIALPRPSAFQPTATTESDFQSLSIPATGQSTTSNQMVSGRSYRLAISGTFSHNTSGSCYQADAAFSTNDCWITRTPSAQSGIGLAIDDNLLSPTTQYSSNHAYSVTYTPGQNFLKALFRIVDRDTSDNGLSLAVTIRQTSQITYSFSNIQPLPGAQVNQPFPSQTVNPGQPSATVPPVSVPSTGVPNVGSLIFSHNPAGQYCLTINVSNQSVSPACVLDPARPLPDTTIPLGGSGPTTPALSTCPNNSCPTVPGPSISPIVVTGPPISAGFPAGSTLTLGLGWTAAIDHLFFQGYDGFFNTGTSLWVPFDYHKTTEATWFSTNATTLSLDLSVNVKDAAGNPLYALPTIKVAGMGQILEAMFNSQVAGF